LADLLLGLEDFEPLLDLLETVGFMVGEGFPPTGFFVGAAVALTGFLVGEDVMGFLVGAAVALTGFLVGEDVGDEV